jgi:hypothetical protein
MSQGFTKGIPLDTDGTLSFNSDQLAATQKAVKTYVDTRIFSIPPGTSFKQNTSFSHTGTIVKTVIYSSLISGVQSNDILRIMAHFTSTSNANVKTVEFYFNTTPDLTGTPILIGTRLLTSLAGSSFVRNIAFKNSLSSQGVIASAVNFANDENVTQSQSLISANFNVAQYIVVSCQLANAGDTVTLNNIIGTLNR